MCTYTTERTGIDGSGKGVAGWFPLRTATVYYDHPVHAQHEHTLNIDFADPSRGPAARVAVELSATSALDLVDAMHAALAAAPPQLTGVPAGRLPRRPRREPVFALTGPPDKMAPAPAGPPPQRGPAISGAGLVARGRQGIQ